MFVVEYALAQQWMAWGMKPSALIGHSLGEYVAAAVAGVFALEDGLMLVAHRARLIAALPPGAMLAVPLPAEEVADLTGDRLSVALVNGDRLTVVAGEPAEVEALERRVKDAQPRTS